MANVHITGTVSFSAVPLNGLRVLNYLPARADPPTVFPKPTGKDYNQQTRMILEKWRRSYPLVPYYPLQFFLNNVSSPPNYAQAQGVGNGTVLDPLYGEPIPSYLANPSDDPVLTLPGAANPKIFHDPVRINVALRRDVKQGELRQYGFDRLRDGLACIPLALLDKHGITVRINDEFVWGRERFSVLQYVESGFWKNSASALYCVMNVQSVTRGS